MKRQFLALGSCLALTLIVAGCQDQTTAPTLAPTTRVASTSELEAQSSLTFGLTARLVPLSDDVSDRNMPAVDGAVTPTTCSASSPINDFLNAEVGNTLARERALFLEMVNNWDVENVPFYEAIYLKSPTTPQVYGYDGEYTHIMQKTERDVKKFWDIPSSDIEVVSMRSDVLFDVERLAATYNYVYGEPYPQATEYAQYVRDKLLGSQTMNGNYSYWTFNAVSARVIFSPTDTMRKIVMGDGILEAYRAIGYGDVAPQAIFAHEYAHQIQFANNYRLPTAGTTAAERTRYTELMADAYSAYYLTHSRGATMNQKRVEEFLKVFFAIGDCSFTASGHHGTPLQRLAAARFGFSVADEAQKQGHILTSAQFFARFQAQYPTLIAP